MREIFTIQLKCEAVKVRVLQSLSRRDALLGVINHHLTHQVNGLVAGIGDQLIQRGRYELREREVDLRCQLVAFRPLSLSRAAQYCTYLVNLISLTVTREQRSLQIQFSHDSAHSEHINGRIIVGTPQENFRSSIPASTDVISKRRTGTNLSGQTEISNLNGVVLD